MSREEMLKLKKDELILMCKEKGISIYKKSKTGSKTRLTNQEMVDAILGNNVVNETPVAENVETKVEQKEIKKEYKNSGVTIGDLVKMPTINENKSEPWVLGNKIEHIEKADVGTLIAFIDEKGKPRTGKLENRSHSRQVIKVVTEFDWTFVVPYDKVLWVRFGTRWPKTIYNMLKGYKNGQQPNIITEEEH